MARKAIIKATAIFEVDIDEVMCACETNGEWPTVDDYVDFLMGQDPMVHLDHWQEWKLTDIEL